MKLISEILGMVFYILIIPVILIVTLFIIVFGKKYVLKNDNYNANKFDNENDISGWLN